ncbi:MAG: hypothetical protein ABSA83_15615 [Verrucomicrobiota bacterium]|jgi:hypothetical protein
MKWWAACNGIQIWQQYTEYRIYKLDGKLVNTVINSAGHYSDSAEVIATPAVKQAVKAQAKDYSRVKVPVTIERGQTKRIHLDENWKPPMNGPKGEAVTGPDGNPMGWRTPVG